MATGTWQRRQSIFPMAIPVGMTKDDEVFVAPVCISDATGRPPSNLDDYCLARSNTSFMAAAPGATSE